MRYTFLFFSLTILYSCSDRETIDYVIDVTDQQKYFLVTEGKSIEYQVDSIVYDPSLPEKSVSFTHYVKEVTGDTFRAPDGLLMHRIERYNKENLTDSWALERIWATAITDRQAIREEDNLRFLRMVFPMDRRSEWNGNLWINQQYEIQVYGERIRPFGGWNYEVDSIDLSRQVGAFAFDSTLVVTEVDETNIIEKRYSKVVYAKNVGLVFKEQWILDSQYCNQNPAPVDCETKPWLEKAENGYIYRQTVIAYD